MILLFIFLFSFVRFPKSKEQNSIDFKHIAQIAFKDDLPWFYFAIAFYVAAEIGMSSWLVTFLSGGPWGERGIKHTNAFPVFCNANARSAWRWICRSAARVFTSDPVASIGSLVCIAAGIFTDFSFLLPTGLFFSIIFPTFTAAVSVDHPENTNSILGILFTFAGLGGLIGPWVIAWVSDLLGLPLDFCWHHLRRPHACRRIYFRERKTKWKEYLTGDCSPPQK